MMNLKKAREILCDKDFDKNDSLCKVLYESEDFVNKFLGPLGEEMKRIVGDALEGSDILPTMSRGDREKMIDDFFEGRKPAKDIWDGLDKSGRGDKKGSGQGTDKGSGLGEKLIFPLFRDPLMRKKLRESLSDFKTAKSFRSYPELVRKGKKPNMKRTFQASLRKGGLDIEWVYNRPPPTKKEDVIWLADVSGSMFSTFAFISPVVDTLRDMGLKQKFFMGDTGDSFMEVPPDTSFGQMLERIGSGGTDIGAGIVNVRRNVKSFKDKSFLIYTDTETDENFKDEVERVAREGGKVLILNPMDKSRYSFKHKNIKQVEKVPAGHNIGGFVKVLKDSREFIMGRRR